MKNKQDFEQVTPLFSAHRFVP